MVEKVIQVVKMAGEIIMKHYDSPSEIQWKDDNSPLTQADLQASQAICNGLKDTGYPVLSEEAEVEYSVRRAWKTFWLVDPLDGTKEFLNRNGEFTINVALIDENQPVLGAVFAPALGILAWAVKGQGAFLETPGGPRRLQSLSADPRIGVRSRSHHCALADRFFEQNGITRDEPVGSALKFLRIAQGEAGLYARFSGSKEWDTAAGQIILLEAGGWVAPQSGKQLLYNKENLSNDNFVAGAANWDPKFLQWPEEP